MSDYRNSEGSTGRWEEGKGFVPFASQKEADASLKPAPAEKPEADTEDAKPSRRKAAE